MIIIRRYLLVRLYLGWHAIAAFGFGLELLFAPIRLVSGPATLAVYGLARPPVWGAAFVLLAIVCGVGGRWPRHAWRVAVLLLSLAQVCWALALFAPLFTNGRTNLLASMPWIALAVTTCIVAWLTSREERQPSAVRGG